MKVPTQPTDVSAAAKAAIAGAVVADGATLGAHWVYEPAQLAGMAAESGATKLCFVDPIAKWHAGTKVAGDVSMYGELGLLTAVSLRKCGHLSIPDLIGKYYSTFGPCGSYSGYCDHATKLCVYSQMKARMEKERDSYPPGNLPATDLQLKVEVPQALPRLAEQHSGEALADAAVDLGKKVAPEASEAGLEWVRRAARAYDAIYTSSHGADDNQSNGNVKLVVAAAMYAGADEVTFDAAIEKLVRATQNNEEAVAWSVPVAHIISGVVTGKTVSEAINSNIDRFSNGGKTPDNKAKVEKALAMAKSAGPHASVEDIKTAVWELGPACQLSSTVPGALYILSVRAGAQATPDIAKEYGSAAAYVQAIVDNLLPGGENCGRAAIVGGVLAAAGARAGAQDDKSAWGVPAAWINDKLASKPKAALMAVLE